MHTKMKKIILNNTFYKNKFLSFLLLLSTGFFLSACGDTTPESNNVISEADETIGELYEGADLVKTSFSLSEEDELYGSSRNFINRKKSKIKKLKLRKNVRFLMDLKNISELAEMKISPNKIIFRFNSLNSRQIFIRKMKRKSHKYGAGFTNRFFSKGAILVGISKKQRIPFVRRVTSIEKDNLDVIINTERVRSRMDMFENISYTLEVPLNPAYMVDKKALRKKIQQRLGKTIADDEIFENADGSYSTLFSEMIKQLEKGNTLNKTLDTPPIKILLPVPPLMSETNRKTISNRKTNGNVNLDDYRNPQGETYCDSSSLINTSLNIQLYPLNQGNSPVKIGTGGCFSIGVSAVVETDNNNYFKAYIEGSEKLWLDLIFASNGNQYIDETHTLIEGEVPLFGAFFVGVSISFGVDLGTKVNVENGTSVVGGFNQQWSMKRGFEVIDGEFIKITDKNSAIEIHPLKIEGAVDIYGEISLQPRFGIAVNLLFLEAAEGGINLKPYVYGEVDFKGETNAGNQTLGAFTYETCYDLGYGVDWNYYITGLFGTIQHTSADFKIIGRKSFLRGGEQQCSPADANGMPASLTQAQLVQVANAFDSCLDWSESWESGKDTYGILSCYLTGDIHYSVMKTLGPAYDNDPTKWLTNGIYTQRYDLWDIGGEYYTTPTEEADLSRLLTDFFVYGAEYSTWPLDSYASLYGAETEADLYTKHAPNGTIQPLIDAQCKEKDNRYIWTEYKSNLCGHNWDWYEDGYYGPDILVVTSTKSDIKTQTIYADNYDAATNLPAPIVTEIIGESYQESRLVYQYDSTDPNQEILIKSRWAPKYCFDWHKVARLSTVPEDMEFFLEKCRYTLLDEPMANINKQVGVNRRALYEKVSEAYCQHLECPFSDNEVALCPGDLLDNDGTTQLTRQKPDVIWNTKTFAWDENTRPLNGCLVKKSRDINTSCYGVSLAAKAHCNDDCNTVPYCSIYDAGTIYCTSEYWDEIKSQCAIGSVNQSTINERFSDSSDISGLTTFNYPAMFEPSDTGAGGGSTSPTAMEFIDEYYDNPNDSSLIEQKVDAPNSSPISFPASGGNNDLR